MKKSVALLCCALVLGGFLMACAEKDNGVTPPPSNGLLTDAIKARLSAAADSVFQQVRTPGMFALFAVEGEPDFVITRGVGNVATGEPINLSNYFRIASNTKTFTGTAVLIQADKGRIDLSRSISSYLPELNVPNGDRITIRMLGNMTSGLYNYTEDPALWTTMAESNFTMNWPPDSLLAMAFRHPVNFEPGTQYEYCNTNTVLLGLLLQKVTGKHPADVIAETVLRPLNLSHTYWGGPWFLFAPYTHGYNSDTGTLADATNFNPSWGYTAGALISTIADLKIWARALAEGALLSDAMKAERFAWIGNHYGFCVMKVNDWIGHPGSITGYNSHVLYKPSKKMTMIVYTNMDTESPVEYFSDAFRRILDN